jgi:hypothetical protein
VHFISSFGENELYQNQCFKLKENMDKKERSCLLLLNGYNLCAYSIRIMADLVK